MCGQVLSLVYDFVHATFSLLQLYFIFKYGNVIVNKRRWLARITFAHCISSCISFWVYTLYSGTLDEIVKKYFPKNIYKEECYYDSSQNVNASINATYMWTSCVKEDFTSIGNNIRCVVNTSKEFVHFFYQTQVRSLSYLVTPLAALLLNFALIVVRCISLKLLHDIVKIDT